MHSRQQQFEEAEPQGSKGPAHSEAERFRTPCVLEAWLNMHRLLRWSARRSGIRTVLRWKGNDIIRMLTFRIRGQCDAETGIVLSW